MNNERSNNWTRSAIVNPIANPDKDFDSECDRNPLAPPALRGDKASYSAPLKFLHFIHGINARILEKWYKMRDFGAINHYHDYLASL